MRKVLLLAVALALMGCASAFANYVRQPNPVIYTVPPPIAPHVPDYRAPWTQYRGHTYVPRSYYWNQSHNYRYEQRYRRNGVFPMVRQTGVGLPQQIRQPNPIKEKYLADCAANGAPVVQLGGGRMHCHRDPVVTTIVD